jgi:hypothetical protein
VQLLVPTLGAMIDKVPQARANRRCAKTTVAAIRRPRKREWMAKHPRFPLRIRNCAHRLERRVGTE